MNINEQKIAIAKVCGWKFDKFGKHTFTNEQLWTISSPNKSEYHLVQDGELLKYIPDYTGDLNVICAVVMNRFSGENQMREYVYNLVDEMSPGQFTVNASAEKRAAAFLKTLKLWK